MAGLGPDLGPNNSSQEPARAKQSAVDRDRSRRPASGPAAPSAPAPGRARLSSPLAKALAGAAGSAGQPASGRGPGPSPAATATGASHQEGRWQPQRTPQQRHLWPPLSLPQGKPHRRLHELLHCAAAVPQLGLPACGQRATRNLSRHGNFCMVRRLPASHRVLRSHAGANSLCAHADQKAEVVYEACVDLDEHAHVLLVMALYHGEGWLTSNCYYWEGPLPGGPPTGPFPGAQWKKELAFRPDPETGDVPPLHLFVFDAARCRRIDGDKYGVRDSMASAVSAPGNCCLHLTDDQSSELAKAPTSEFASAIPTDPIADCVSATVTAFILTASQGGLCVH
jgi:hypothetical protein